MARGRGADDELSRWATAQAASLLARAEEEAVAVLRDALVDAALARRDVDAHAALSSEKSGGLDRPRTPDPPKRGSESAPGELLWAYCVLRAAEPFPVDMAGVGEGGVVLPVQSGGLTALVSSVPRAEFGADALRRNLNDIHWLERVARAHAALLDAALQMSTIVPLRLCTLYESRDAVELMLERERDAFTDALTRLDGRCEWAVKVLIDEERLMRAAHVRSAPAEALERELEGQGEGGAYLLRRRLERQLRDAASNLATEVAQQVHARLQDWALDAVTHPPQNRELSGHEGEMLLNGAYLVERARVAELRELVTELEARHAELGVHIELSGPWPPYNFVSGRSTSAV